MSKNSIATLKSGSDFATLDSEMVSLNLDSADFDYHYLDSSKILDQKLEKHFILTELDDILFELSEKYCFVDSSHLYPLVEHSGGDWYDIFYTPMSEDNMGMVKIIATIIVDGEEVVLYTAVIMGREFKSQAKE